MANLSVGKADSSPIRRAFKNGLDKQNTQDYNADKLFLEDTAMYGIYHAVNMPMQSALVIWPGRAYIVIPFSQV